MTTDTADTIATVIGEKPYVLRLPPKLKATLERLARQNRRSLNSEILIRLEQSVEDAEQSKP